MDAPGAGFHQKYLGSFRIHLRPCASTEEVPASTLVNIVGAVIYILEGRGERLSRGWKFSVKGYAFGWSDANIEVIYCNNQEIFNENFTRG